jgi:bifunctional DNA-binding transcriptional regulator/antitoxin component of YhaV-PrlF toxin-antitoxin module
MGEITTLTKAATKTTSLRTTVPASIVRQFSLKDGDKLDWSLDIKDGKMIVSVQPIKKAENATLKHH